MNTSASRLVLLSTKRMRFVGSKGSALPGDVRGIGQPAVQDELPQQLASLAALQLPATGPTPMGSGGEVA